MFCKGSSRSLPSKPFIYSKEQTEDVEVDLLASVITYALHNVNKMADRLDLHRVTKGKRT